MTQSDRITLFAIAAFLFANLVATIGIAVRPPQASFYAGVAEDLGRSQAQVLILQAQLKQAQDMIQKLQAAPPQLGGKK